MPRLMPCAMLTVLLASCGSSYPVAVPVEPCRVPAFPAPLDIAPQTCGEMVCFTVEDTLAFLRWEAAVEEYRLAVARCPGVA
jgi:hypothetical protein